MTKKVEPKKKEKNPELPGMPPKGDLTRECEMWLDQKEKVETDKSNLMTIGNRVLDLMEKDKQIQIIVHYDGKTKVFYNEAGTRRLKVKNAAQKNSDE